MKNKITIEQAELAIKTILEYLGENPLREGLKNTPQLVINSYKEIFKGYSECPKIALSKTINELKDYNEIILVKNIRVESCCEHHMVPIIGKAHVAYLPNGKVVGISKIAKIVEIFSKRLQIQERLTTQIASSIDKFLKPKGVAVIIKSSHQCLSKIGLKQVESSIITKCMKGVFSIDNNKLQEFYSLILV